MQIAQAPAAGETRGTQRDREIKDKLVIDPADAAVKKLEPQIREHLERATNMLFHPDMLRRPAGATEDPIDLRPVYNREGLRIEVVSDLKAAWKKYNEGKDPSDPEYKDMDAFTVTTKDKDGKATGTVIVMDISLFQTSRHTDSGRTLQAMPKVLAALCHELHHCRQPMYPENGKVPTLMPVATREYEVYSRQQADLDRIYNIVADTGVRDYAERYGVSGPGGKRTYGGEAKVDEHMNFELFSRVLKPTIELFKARMEKERAAPAATPALPSGAITIPAGGGKDAKPVVIDPKHKDSFAVISAALKDKTTVTAVAEGDLLFRIKDKDGRTRDIILSRNFRSEEQQARALALGVRAMESMREINSILKKEGYTSVQLVLMEHATGSPDRKIGIVGTTKSGQTELYGSYTVRPTDEVQQIGQGRFESWETEILAALKAGKRTK